jgi:alpha-beta hydrolase superfamily lysophospholipase
MKPGFFDAADGVKLYCDWYPSAVPARAGVVLIHGYADHCGRYANAARHLAERGFPVIAFDYRGHGQAGGRRGHCEAFGEFVADLDRALGQARQALGELPLVVLAHSHGGLIALRALCDPAQAPRGVAALVMSAPFLAVKVRVSPVKRALARVTSRVVPRLSLSNEIDPAILSHDPDVVAARRVDRFCHKVATARWYTEATAAQGWVQENAHRLAVPSLWLIAGDDHLVDPDATRRAFDRAGGDKTKIEYAGLYHELLLEKERSRVLADIDAWLDARFPAH